MGLSDLKANQLPVVLQKDTELDTLYTVSSSSEQVSSPGNSNNSNDFDKLPATLYQYRAELPTQLLQSLLRAQHSLLSVYRESASQPVARIASLREDNKDIPESQIVPVYQSCTRKGVVPTKQKIEQDLYSSKYQRTVAPKIVPKPASKSINSNIFYSQR